VTWVRGCSVVAALVLVVGFVTIAPVTASTDGPQGSAYGWGWNAALGTNGALADDTFVPVDAAIRASGDDSYVQISVGDGSACGLTDTGDAYCWGLNDFGQLGKDDTFGTDQPTAVVAGANASGSWSSIDFGAEHACGIAPDDSAYCWGQGSLGQLGDGSALNRSSPARVLDGENTSGTWKQISAGGYITCGIGGDDSAYCWGSGANGSLGNGVASNSTSPVRVDGGPYVSVGSGVEHACAVTGDFAVECWGLNTSGQLGNGTLSSSLVPVAVALSSGESAWSVDAGDVHTCAVLSDMRLRCWGGNAYGQLGRGYTGDPEPMPGFVDWNQWISLSVGSLTTCAVERYEQRAYCWGFNGSGQVGDGTFDDRASPTEVLRTGVLNNLRVSGISTGLRTSMASRKASTIALALPAGDAARLDSSNFLDVGEAAPGSPTTGSITLTNSGNVAMHVASPLLRIVGPNAPAFAISADTCSGQIVLAGATCQVSVTATPTRTGPILAVMPSNPLTIIGNERVELAARGSRTLPVYPTRTWFVAQSGTANFAAGTSCSTPDMVGSDDTAIQTVLDAVSADDTVYVCAGTYGIDSTLNVDDSITIQGEGADATVLDGGSAVQVMRLLDYGLNSSTHIDPVVTVQDMAIVNGAAGLAGGPHGESCNLYPDCGGAIYAEDGTSLTVVDMVFEGNQASFGGGAIGTTGETDYAGGLIDVSSSTFIDNVAGIDSGAIGIYFNFKGGAPLHTIRQSTFVGNEAWNRAGGAIGLAFANAVVEGSTFLDNSAGYIGDALAGDLTVSGSIIASATSTTPGDLCAGGTITNSVSTDDSCVFPATAYADLKIQGLGDWGGPTPTVWIGPGSAADNANAGTCAAVDQRGASRSASPCDAGAVERRSGSAQATASDLTYAASAVIGVAATPLTLPAVAAAAPAPRYSTGSAACTVNAISGEVTGVAVGDCTVAWSIAPSLTQDGASGDDSLMIVKATQPALTVVAPASAEINTSVTLLTLGGAGTGAVTYSVGASTVCSVTGATLSLGDVAGTCTVTATKDADASYDVITSAPVTIAVEEPSGPPVTQRPSAPREPEAGEPVIAGDGQILVRWQGPASTGSFAVSTYQATAAPGGFSCLVPATQTSCTLRGLTNGTTYQVRVRALSGAGWGDWSQGVEATPRASKPDDPVIVTATGAREKRWVRVVAKVEGPASSTPVLMVRLPGQRSYRPLRVDPVKSTADRTVWKWRVGKRVSAYVQVGDVRSERVVIPRWRG